MDKTNSKNKIRSYLESQTKEELIDLILKFAPQSFVDNINSRSSNKKQALAIFNKTSSAIEKILCDDELLYSPNEFESALLKQLEKFRGLWDKLPLQIGVLIIKIIEEIEQAFENGYLYLEGYGEEDDYFESEEVNDYIFQFVEALPEETLFDYVEKLKDTLSESSYSTFMSLEQKISKII
ncbi:MAG: hypothetical protein HQM14_20675 [SAR324 cluster bacterium]|nr:hypothetical protein [SAR324 cluster bacterium]